MPWRVLLDFRNNTNSESIKNSDPEEFREDLLYQKYLRSKMDYYRHVLRKHDEEMLKRIGKIPDSWEDYDRQKFDSPAEITENTKKRLSDIKNFKSWELRFESLFVYYFTTIEHIFISCLNFRPIPDEKIDEAIDSAESLILEIGGNIMNFKHLLLSLAKRSVSDFYYLMITYFKFYKNINMDFENNFKEFCTDVIDILKEYKKVKAEVEGYIKLKAFIDGFFSKSSNVTGLRLNEFSLKEYMEKESQDGLLNAEKLKRIAFAGYRFKNRVKKNLKFIKYYYNEKDGKLFRYSFIVDSLKNKLREKKITVAVFDGMKNIRGSFLEVKEFIDNKRLEEGGPPLFNYSMMLEFVYKCCKIIEFRYLREQKHEELQNLRNDMLYYVENEMIHLHASG